MTLKLLRDGLREYFSFFAIEPPLLGSGVEAGLDEAVDELDALAHEAARAARREVPLDEAARDYDHFPTLARIHALVGNMLTLTLPPELYDWLRLVASSPPSPDQAMRHLDRLARYAVSGQHEELRPLCRFLLFELLRLEPLLDLRLHPWQTFGVGMTVDDIDALALRALDIWLEILRHLPKEQDVSPIRLMAHEVVIGVDDHLSFLREALARIDHDVRQQLDRRAAFEAVLSHVAAEDAVLLRNALPGLFDVQPLEIQHLIARNPAVFEGANAVSVRKRLDRLRDRVVQAECATILRRPRAALLDLVAELRGLSLPAPGRLGELS